MELWRQLAYSDVHCDTLLGRAGGVREGETEGEGRDSALEGRSASVDMGTFLYALETKYVVKQRTPDTNTTDLIPSNRDVRLRL